MEKNIRIYKTSNDITRGVFNGYVNEDKRGTFFKNEIVSQLSEGLYGYSTSYWNSTVNSYLSTPEVLATLRGNYTLNSGGTYQYAIVNKGQGGAISDAMIVGLFADTQTWSGGDWVAVFIENGSIVGFKNIHNFYETDIPYLHCNDQNVNVWMTPSYNDYDTDITRSGCIIGAENIYNAIKAY